jgi:asparagine synthase (glutamine-hydrolysing)
MKVWAAGMGAKVFRFIFKPKRSNQSNMCGIAGYLDFNRRSDAATLERMTDTLLHRGPDDAGYWQSRSAGASIGFGHRRLSVIDLSAGGRQPMRSADGRWTITYNGEIYNYKELREELLKKGYAFHSQSDTEVILHAFDCWGQEAVHRFAGMFAFALYDQNAGHLYLYRDRGGAKPLYYYWYDGLFMFASELKAFHAHPGFIKNIDRDAFRVYFRLGRIPAPRTPFLHTFKLLPAQWLRVETSSRTLTLGTYWDIADLYLQPKWSGSDREAVEATEEALRASCRRRMVADVPVGVFLSGGYDSSVIAALLQSSGTEAIQTFSVGFEQAGYDETPFARQVAEHLGTRHQNYFCTPAEALEIARKLPDVYDEPLADASAVPLILLSRLARREVKVALTGDAADELFAGYTKYKHVLKYWNIFGHLPESQRLLLSKILTFPAQKVGFLSKNTIYWAKQLEKAGWMLRGKNPAEALQWLEYGAPGDLRTDLPGLKNLEDTEHPNQNFPGFLNIENPNKLTPLESMLVLEYQSILADDFLVKTDRATMSVGLEGREPYLDHGLAAFVAGLPEHLKIRDGQTKWVLRQIAHRYLPPALMERPKMGFPAPVASWLRGAFRGLCDEYFDKKRIESAAWLQYEAITRLRTQLDKGHDHCAPRLWKLLMFELWHERWMS